MGENKKRGGDEKEKSNENENEKQKKEKEKELEAQQQMVKAGFCHITLAMSTSSPPIAKTLIFLKSESLAAVSKPYVVVVKLHRENASSTFAAPPPSMSPSSCIHHLVAPQCHRCATQKPIIRHHLQQLERNQIHGRDSCNPRTATTPPSPSTIVSSLKQFHHRETIYHRESENQSTKKSKIAQPPSSHNKPAEKSQISQTHNPNRTYTIFATPNRKTHKR
ncbi:hypothetical protein V8G54_001642 [Vigna mungo]|uniref:Uncharacterized protein n=1 Tax=Vigna mungo TaxID=3915 RepID=A0AAQ3P7S4_VIGMU